MATNNILTFAETAAALDIYTDVEYLADTDQATGNKAGKAKRKLVNKTLKQTAKIAAGVAQFLADIQTTNITDALTTAQISTILQSSLLSNGIKRVRVASTVAISIAAPGAAIDGVTMVAGERFLEKDNATASARVIYVWNGAAVPATRALDSDNGAKFPASTIVSVSEGTLNADTNWQVTNDGAVIIGTTALTFGNVAGITQAQADARYVGIGYMFVRDEKASATVAGSSVATAMPTAQTRVLNTVVSNNIAGASLSANQITLPAGTYRFNADAPSTTNAHRAFLFNVTDAVVSILGTNENCKLSSDADPVVSRSIVRGKLPIASTKVFELRHFTSEASATIGLGTAMSLAGYNEIFSQIEIIKES